MLVVSHLIRVKSKWYRRNFGNKHSFSGIPRHDTLALTWLWLPDMITLVFLCRNRWHRRRSGRYNSSIVQTYLSTCSRTFSDWLPFYYSRGQTSESLIFVTSFKGISFEEMIPPIMEGEKQHNSKSCQHWKFWLTSVFDRSEIIRLHDNYWLKLILSLNYLSATSTHNIKSQILREVEGSIHHHV